jgi:hypothetical protein
LDRQILTLLTDDLDDVDAERTIQFGLDGVNYTIDLSRRTSASADNKLAALPKTAA